MTFDGKKIGVLLVFFVLNFVALYSLALKAMPKGPGRGNDIFFIYRDGQQIANGINPYSRIHGSDMRKNKKYSTYLPGFFLFVALMVKLGLDSFEEFVKVWQVSAVLIHSLFGTLIFSLFSSRSLNLAGLVLSLIYLYNRFTLNVMFSGQLDILGALMFVVAIYFSNPYLFGVSLAIKQVALIFLPFFVVLLSQGESLAERFKCLVVLTVKALAVPILVSLPFLVDDAEAFLKSIAFSVTREAGAHIGGLKSLDVVIGLDGFLARVPMLSLLLIALYVCWRQRITMFKAALLVFCIFYGFNPVLLNQYFVWGVALVPFLFLDEPARGLGMSSGTAERVQ